MRKYKYFFWLIYVACQILFAPVFGQNDITYYEAFVHNQFDKWKELLDSNHSKNDQITDLQYLYGYIGWCIREGRKEEGKIYLQKMESYLEDKTLSEFNYNLYKSIALSYGVLLGVRNPMINGPKILKYSDRALKADPTSAMACIQKGNTFLNMPAVFGGSRKKAVIWFQKARKLFEEKGDISQNWLYLHLLCSIIEVCEAEGEKKMAEAYYQKIRLLEPELFWLKKNKGFSE